jgi:Xaa-Pro aminopeptidase
MAQDGAALCEFFAWFEAAMAAGETVTELDVDTHITAARARRPGFVTTSFATIAAYNANGAMPHYQATARSYAQIRGDGLLLIDSGGQYLGGTTDITRVVPVGSPSRAQKEDFTTVLQGHIDLAMARFPAGTPSSVLDTLARMPLWQRGLDYGHGTGHGVGYFLNVHEGPQSISVRAHARPHQDMLAGMLTSDEPGLYRPDQWGIRIESLLLAVPAGSTEFGDFLRFEAVTLCPIDTRCVLRDQLSPPQLEWLNAYHAQVRERLLPLVTGTARGWLMVRTEPL